MRPSQKVAVGCLIALILASAFALSEWRYQALKISYQVSEIGPVFQ